MEHVSRKSAAPSHRLVRTTRRRFSNQQLANILYEMSMLYEMKGVDFKPRAYERAAHGVESFADSLQDVFAEHGEEGLKGIPGVGAGIQEHLKELFTTGHFKEYERFKKQVPVDIIGLTAVQGVGPKTIKTLWKRLHVKDVADLEKAARAGKISKIPHFGKRTEQELLKSIDFLNKSGHRFILGFVAADAEWLRRTIARMPEVKQVEIAGSFRRAKETVGDLDILVASSKPQQVMSKLLRLPAVSHVYGTGPTKTSLRLKSGINVDVRIIPLQSWGAALNYFTGSEPHNIALRKIAQRHGWKLSEYGLFKGKTMLAGATETQVYRRLGLPYIEPELREMTGELDAAKARKLPKLIGYDALQGDLQVQTNWSDGGASIEKMADAAEAAGLSYIAITDHTKSLAMTNGLDEKRIIEQAKGIATINKKRKAAGKRLTILSGSEVNIKKDGSLDIGDDVLAKLDVVGAAVHSFFDLPRREQTARLVRAMENPNVDIIFHPTCRLINSRPEIQLDIDEVIKTAKRTGTVLEIDAYPDRLDLRDEYIKKCVQAGVLLSIDSDAHAPEHFALLKFGIGQARRGWASAGDVINTLPLEKMRKKLK
jgi:DNA polymerase (family X)